MGLDYGMVRVKHGAMEQCANEREKWELWNDDTELAYGRKSWELADMFKTDLSSCMSPLDPKDWDRFIVAVEKFGYDKMAKARGDFWREDITEDETTDICVDFEKWYDETFNEYPTLGYDFAIGYIMNFYEADAAVRKAWAEGDEVWTFASY